MGGQFLDVVESARSWDGIDTAERVSRAERVIRYKSAKYTVEHPLLIGAALAGGSPAVDEALVAYARPLGAAFQLLDDLADGDAGTGATRDEALRSVAAAAAALDDHAITPPAAAALRALADLVGTL